MWDSVKGFGFISPDDGRFVGGACVACRTHRLLCAPLTPLLAARRQRRVARVLSRSSDVFAHQSVIKADGEWRLCVCVNGFLRVSLLLAVVGASWSLVQRRARLSAWRRRKKKKAARTIALTERHSDMHADRARAFAIDVAVRLVVGCRVVDRRLCAHQAFAALA